MEILLALVLHNLFHLNCLFILKVYLLQRTDKLIEISFKVICEILSHKEVELTLDR